MKKTTQTLAATITATLISTMIVSADNIDNKDKDKKAPPKHMLDKFDKDGDGTLNENERNELKQVMSERRKQTKAKILKRFDSNGNGELSPDEKKAATPIIAEERKKIKAAVLEQFDKDSDGKLSMDEREGAREWVKQNYPEAIALRARKAGFGKGFRAQERASRNNKLN
jgi:Ca2+-binding EF-hand superfamily protein